MTDLIDAEIAAVKRIGHKDGKVASKIPASRGYPKNLQEVKYFIDLSRSRRENEAKAKKKSNVGTNDTRKGEEKNEGGERRGASRDRSKSSPVERRRRSRSPPPRRNRRSSRSPPRQRRRSPPRWRRGKSRSLDRKRRRSRSRSYGRRRRSRSVDRRRRRGRRRSLSRERRRSRTPPRSRKKRSSDERRRARSRSASTSSSSSSSSTESTALIQKILQQNAKGAMAVQQHITHKQRAKTEPEKGELIKAQAIALSQGAVSLSNSPLELVKRQLYIGNLPIGIQPNALVEFLNQAMVMRKLNTTPGNTFLRANLSGDGSFGFATLRSIEETDSALLNLNGIQCLGQTLKLGRPKNYEGSGPSADAFGIPLHPLNIGANDAQALLKNLEKKLEDTYKETGVPSPVIRIENMLTEATVKDKEELSEIKEEVEEECKGYGSVVQVRMPDVGDVNNLFVYVHMSAKQEAQIACDKLAGRSFDGKALKVRFFPLDEFLALAADQASPTSNSQEQQPSVSSQVPTQEKEAKADVSDDLD